MMLLLDTLLLDTLLLILQAACQLSEHTLAQTMSSQTVKCILYRNNAYLFMTVKIVEMGLANMDRIMVFWPIVTAHLIEVASHPNTELRDGGLEALTRLVVAALAHPRTPPIQESPGLQQVCTLPGYLLATLRLVVTKACS
jgi:hypothetical protein